MVLGPAQEMINDDYCIEINFFFSLHSFYLSDGQAVETQL